ncbi:MAG: NAD-dependent epimerase/dehydratase family protein, partial [Anaerolineae bacterium]|nr:NAD-dependent epimerase/dehydratase family protein [Anaerolineae bacterium]
MTKGRILVLGGDGFCGWPTSLRLSSEGYDVTIIDNLSRRKIDVELGCRSLTPIETIETRLKVWKALTGRTIDFINLNLAEDYYELLDVIRTQKPQTIVHFAEQRAAPYSMKSPRHKRYTVNNNINGTHNVLCAIVESGVDVHLVHLGTMGVYGYGT